MIRNDVSHHLLKHRKRSIKLYGLLLSRLRGRAIKCANFCCRYVVAQLKFVLTVLVEGKTRRHVRPDSKFYPNFQHPTARASIYASCSGL